jgi:hypothetical protein
VDVTGSSTYAECGEGTFQPNSGQSLCLDAPPGSFVDTTGATEATPCAVGTYNGASAASSCAEAPPGTYVDTTGAIAATNCPLGTYQANSGQTACTPAPPNTYVGTEGATSPTPCPSGAFNPNSGSTSVAACMRVVLDDPGNQSDYINAAITALGNSEINGITPVFWSATGLPAGLAIDPTSGTVTGTPTTPCTCAVTLTVTDAEGNTGTTTFTWSILGFGIATTSLPMATPGTPYGPVTLEVGGLGVSASPSRTTLKWKKITLPKGLKLSSAGVLSGTPSAKLAAPTSVTVQVTETVITLNGKKKVKTPTTVQATIPFD